MNHLRNRNKIYEGKAKILFQGPEPNTLIQYFKDDATAYNAEKKAVIEGKGVLNNLISEHLFNCLKQIRIPTCLIKRISRREQLIHKLEIIPVEVIVRNTASGSLSKRLGIEEGKKFSRPIVEFCYKSDSLGDPLITDDHIITFGWALPHEIEDMVSLALRINDCLSGIFCAVQLELIDFKLEFGRLFDENGDSCTVLADEISPDTCRLWDVNSKERLDKDVFRKDLGDLITAYEEVARRLGIDQNENKKGKGDSDISQVIEFAKKTDSKSHFKGKK